MPRTRVGIRPLCEADEEEFLACVRRSRNLHHPWASPPASARSFQAYLARTRTGSHRTSLICLRATGEMVGVVNLSEIVRGCFRSAYLGYYAFEPHAGQGYMTEGLRLVVGKAFRELKLHRLEANIQPSNGASIALIRSLGFKKEGFSPKYLKIGGRWQDHERWAILAGERRASAKGRRAPRT